MTPFLPKRLPSAPNRRPAGGLAGRDFLLLLAATVGTFSNYAPLLSVVSLWSAEGGAGNGGIGAATGVTMATTVGVQLVMGRLLRRYGLRRLLAVGALILGLPTFAYALSSQLAWVLGVSALRGVGFGLVAVAGSALVAELVPTGQRGRAVGWYGVAVGLPQMVCLPLGVWCAERFGFGVVFAVTGAVSVAAVPLVGLMSGRSVEEDPPRSAPQGTPAGDPAASTWTAAALRPLAGPWTVLIGAACALGGVTSFLPLALEGGEAAPTALFVLTSAVIAGRWAAGVFSDRVGAGRLLVPAVVACGLGTGGFSLTVGESPGTDVWIAAAAALVYGAGFGVLQNDTLVVMFRRAGPGGHGAASTAWNMAYDAGTGAGAAAIGAASQGLGLGGALAAAAVLILAVTPLARGDSAEEQKCNATA